MNKRIIFILISLMSFSSLCGCGRVIEPEIVTETESEETNETDAEPDTATDIAEMSEVAAGSDLENDDVHGIFMKQVTDQMLDRKNWNIIHND